MEAGCNSSQAQPPTKATPPGGTLGWVGPYQLVERLPYQGGPIEYLARQRGPLDFVRSCRLKLVPSPSHGGDRRVAEAVVREAKVVLRLDHPNIVRLYDLFEHGHNLVLAMEHFSSLSLGRLLELLVKQRKQLDESAVWHIAHCLFDALAHAHGVVDGAGNLSPVVHSDVRPSNIMVTVDGRVRLSGFGHARIGDSDDWTACGKIGNGASYAAPEQVQGRNFTERVDTFAAALTIWELLAGRSATPDGLGDVERMQYLYKREVEPLRGLRPDLPPLVTTAIDACLTVDPEERTIQAAEVAGCIAAAMDLRAGARALREAVVSLGAVWEGLAAGDPSASPVPRTGRSVPPSSSRRDRKPAFSVVVPSAAPLPNLMDAMPPWEEVTRVPEPPKSKLVDPPRPSPVNAIRAMSAPPPSRRGPTSLSPTSASALADTVPPTNRAPRSTRQWVMAVPLAMVVAVVTFAAVGTLTKQKAPAAAVQGMHATAASAAVPLVQRTAVTQPTVAAAVVEPTVPTPVEPSPAKEATASPAVEIEAPVPVDRAVLVVDAPPEGWVYVQGTMVGRTGQPIETACGKRFVRVGTQMDEHGMLGVSWLSQGQGVLLRCGKRHLVPATPPTH
jgi:eukaryotic-like serine/threonine-protein kinase